jgi:hypothetical protein
MGRVWVPLTIYPFWGKIRVFIYFINLKWRKKSTFQKKSKQFLEAKFNVKMQETKFWIHPRPE